MSLFSGIEESLKQAMRNKEAEKLSLLRLLKSAVKYAAIEKGGADYVPKDEEVLAVVRKEIKKRQDSVESYEKANRPELAAKERQEIDLLQAYLPAALSTEEVEKIVREAMTEAGATSKAHMGAVMKLAQAKAAGRVDGKALSGVVQRLLG